MPQVTPLANARLTMKDSSSWVRQPKVDKTADEIVAERGCHPSEVKPYWVAGKLGVQHNGALSEKVFDWRRRRLAENVLLTIEVPPQAEATFREQFEQFGRDAVETFRRTVRAIGSELDQAATLRINDAERRRDQAEVDRDDVLTLCRQAEDGRAELEAQIAELQGQLVEARRANDRLLGRLEQRQQDARAEGAQVATEGIAEGSELQPKTALLVNPLANGRTNDAELAGDGVEAAASTTSVTDDDTAGASGLGSGSDQPWALETVRPTGGQVETPGVIETEADQTGGDGDDVVRG